MKKVLSILKSTLRVLSNQYFRLMGFLWIFASFAYIGDPEFWTVLGFGTVFTGIQSIIEK